MYVPGCVHGIFVPCRLSRMMSKQWNCFIFGLNCFIFTENTHSHAHTIFIRFNEIPKRTKSEFLITFELDLHVKTTTLFPLWLFRARTRHYPASIYSVFTYTFLDCQRAISVADSTFQFLPFTIVLRNLKWPISQAYILLNSPKRIHLN